MILGFSSMLLGLSILLGLEPSSHGGRYAASGFLTRSANLSASLRPVSLALDGKLEYHLMSNIGEHGHLRMLGTNGDQLFHSLWSSLSVEP